MLHDSFGDTDGLLILFPLKGIEFTFKLLMLGLVEFILIIHNQITSEDFCCLGYVLIFVKYANYICNRIKQTLLFPPTQATTHFYFSTRRIPGGVDSRK